MQLRFARCGACDKQGEAALAAVVAKSGPVSTCVYGVFTGDCSAAGNDRDRCAQLVGFDLAAPTLYWKSPKLACVSSLKMSYVDGYSSSSMTIQANQRERGGRV